MSLKIVFEYARPLPVQQYGGIERMMYWQMKEMARQGHKPVLIGHPDSQVEKDGIELIPHHNSKNWWQHIPKDADGLLMYHNFIPPTEIPVIYNIGGNGKVGEKFSKNSVFVSKKHAELHGSDMFIYNALDLSEYPFHAKERKWDKFLFLAKASWKVKNLKHAVKACKKNKKHLHICGGRSMWPSSYIHNHGMVGGSKKLELMAECDAIIFPVRWHEPFGLAVIEAMAMGIPAITSPYGSMNELINKDVGIICHNYDELETTLRNPREFSSETIRKYVENHFSIEHHTKSFIKLFEQIIATGKPLTEYQPEWTGLKPAQSLLPF